MASSVFAEGTEVLAPDKEHVLHRAVVVGSPQDASAAGCPVGYILTQFLDSGKTFGLPEARLVPWVGYAERVIGAQAKAYTPKASSYAPKVSVWRSVIWTEGLFSMLFWALGWLESEALSIEKTGVTHKVLIDWTDNKILFHGGDSSGSANVWNDFFEQPRINSAGPLTLQEFEAAESEGSLSVVVRFGPPWYNKFGEFRGADEGTSGSKHIRGGRLDVDAISRGRTAFRRWVTVRSHLQDQVDGLLSSLLGALPPHEWLAVHIRQTDKLEQCEANALEVGDIVSQAVACSKHMGCRGVFLCSDDASLKIELSDCLKASGLCVAIYDALLSRERSQPSHKDQHLDRRRNARDVLLEVLLMSRCKSLLSTWSNVSVATVYFSSPGYLHVMFGDVLESRVGEMPIKERLCGHCGSPDPMARCSRCRATFVCDVVCRRSAWKVHKKTCIRFGT